MWSVLYLPEAEAERARIPKNEQVALEHADEKLREHGPRLRFPHQSGVKGPEGVGLRELRPRGGHSPWRALYRQVGDVFVVAAVCPEALVKPRKFARGCRDAQDRLAQIEEE